MKTQISDYAATTFYDRFIKHMNRRLIMCMVFSQLLVANNGCVKKAAALATLEQKAAVMEKINVLYFQYANGDPGMARKSLLQSVDILENARCFENGEQAGLACIEYSRLAVMAHKLREKDAEEAYFLSAKYYQLRCLEQDNVPLQTAIKQINQMTIEQQTILIEKLDRNILHGKMASYNQSISSQPMPRATLTNNL